MDMSLFRYFKSYESFFQSDQIDEVSIEHEQLLKEACKTSLMVEKSPT